MCKEGENVEQLLTGFYRSTLEETNGASIFYQPCGLQCLNTIVHGVFFGHFLFFSHPLFKVDMEAAEKLAWGLKRSGFGDVCLCGAGKIPSHARFGNVILKRSKRPSTCQSIYLMVMSDCASYLKRKNIQLSRRIAGKNLSRTGVKCSTALLVLFQSSTHPVEKLEEHANMILAKLQLSTACRQLEQATRSIRKWPTACWAGRTNYCVCSPPRLDCI